MKRFAALIVVCLLLIISPITGCNQSKAEEVTFDQLFSNLSGYSNKEVTMEGFYFHGFEIIVLSERLEYSGFAEGHLVPKGRLIWVSGGIPKEVYDKLNQQQMMGPVERYGKVKVTGKFEHGGKYGHIGGYDQQITPTETTILPWSPPVTETPKGEGFAIYLLARDVPVPQRPVLSNFELADSPFLSLGDIVSYIRETHEIELDLPPELVSPAIRVQPLSQHTPRESDRSRPHRQGGNASRSAHAPILQIGVFTSQDFHPLFRSY